MQKKWSVADVRHVFPCVSSGLPRPSSENDSQGHVDLSQMSGPGIVGGRTECGAKGERDTAVGRTSFALGAGGVAPLLPRLSVIRVLVETL